MSSRYKAFPLGEGGRGPDEGRVYGNDPLTGNKGKLCPHQPPAGGSPEGEAFRIIYY